VPDRPSGRDTAFLPTAGLVRRLLCLLYEGLLLTGVAFGATLALLLAAGFYFVPQWRAGHTLPMKTWRIRIVDASGERLTMRRAVVRYGWSVVSWMLAGAGYLWALADRDGQFLHDRLAGTRLVGLPR